MYVLWNNAWNDAQAMLFAGTFGVNVLDSSSGYTKNGNNILDAFFDLVDVDGVFDGSIHGFTNYDVPQIARGLMHLSDNMKKHPASGNLQT